MDLADSPMGQDTRKHVGKGCQVCGEDGKFFVWIRYDLPESMNSLVLVPNGSGIDYKAKIAAGETPTHENEDIVLLK